MMVIKLVIVVVVAAVAPSVGVTSGTRWSRQAGRQAGRDWGRPGFGTVCYYLNQEVEEISARRSNKLAVGKWQAASGS